MAELVTGTEMIERVRDIGDLQGAMSDTKILREINGAIKTLWRLLLLRDSSYARVSTTITTADLSLPNDFMALLGLWRAVTPGSDDYQAVAVISEEQYRDTYDDSVTVGRPGFGWLDEGALVIRPLPVVLETLNYTYLKTAPTLASAASSFDAVSDHDEYVVTRAAGRLTTDVGRGQYLRADADKWESSFRSRTEIRVRQAYPMWGQ